MVAKDDSLADQELADSRYEVTDLLGEGGMGRVYKAFDANLGTDVVIKVPRQEMLKDPGFAQRFAQEIRALVNLSHPHIVKVTDVGLHDELPFAVMQYLSGGCLEDRRPRDAHGASLPMPAEDIESWLPDVAAALDFIHKQGFVHRDIKPANILFDAHGNVFLSDFGVAKVVTSAAESNQDRGLTGAGMILGTPDYMAPELVLGKEYDGRIDQYALGVMVYEMLAGRLPFDGATPTAVMVQHSNELPRPLSELNANTSNNLSSVVMRTLEKDSTKRYATCRDFARAFAEQMRGAPLQQRYAGGQQAPVKVRCPNPDCQQSLRLEAKHAGTTARCKACDTELRIGHDLSVALASSATTATTKANSDTVTRRSATQFLTAKAPELTQKSRVLREALIAIAFADDAMDLPDVHVLANARATRSRLQAEIAEQQQRSLRISQERSEMESIVEQLAKAKEQKETAEKNLLPLHEPLGELVYQGMLAGSLANQQMFSERMTSGEKLAALNGEYDKLDKASGFIEKAKAKAQQAVLWGKIRYEETVVKAANTRLGKRIVEETTERKFECVETADIVSQITQIRRQLSDAQHSLEDQQRALEDKRSEIQAKLGLERIQYPKQLEKEVIRCEKVIDSKNREIAALALALPDRLIKLVGSPDVVAGTAFGDALLELYDVEAALKMAGAK